MKFYLLFLRAYSLLLISAIFAVVMPTAWMVAIAEFMEVTLVPSPLSEYLTRSLSLLYAVTGVVLWYVSTDHVRYWPLLRFWGWTIIVFGVLMGMIDVASGLPAQWLVSIPTTIGSGILMLYLQKRAEPELDTKSEPSN